MFRRVSVLIFLPLLATACFTEDEGPGPDNRPHICTEVQNICGDMALVAAGAVCIPVGEGYRCECPGPGLRLNDRGQCEDIRECMEFELATICGADATSCSNTTGSFNCSCKSGYTTDGPGTPCRLANNTCEPGYAPTGHNGACEDIRECMEFELSELCGANATSCTNTPGSFNCHCQNGYQTDGSGTPCRAASNNCDPGYAPTGQNGACQDINECTQPLSEVCGANATGCSNRPGSFNCTCPAGFTNDGEGTRCRPYENNCDSGYAPTGTNGACQDINECTVFPLAQACGLDASACINRPGHWECSCKAGFRSLSPGEHCVPAPNDCADGYLPTGPNGLCQDINECTAYGTLGACGPEGTACRNRVGGFECDCVRGYRQNNPAEACRPAENACLTGYAPTGINGACENIKECELNDLEILCGAGATRCSDTVGSYECHCLPGYKTNGRGTPCEQIPNNCQPGFAPTGSNGACQDINECQVYDRATLCGAVSTGCLNSPSGTYTCQCPQGFQTGGPGTPCVDNDPCGSLSAEQVCGVSGAVCHSRPGTFFCECPAGYTNQVISGNTTGEGTRCVDVNECANPGYCSAYCVNQAGSAQCISSIANEDSPYWDNYCFGSSRYFDHPTDFDMDCRCASFQRNRPDDPADPINVAHNACERVGTTERFEIGTGPSAIKWRIGGGADFGATRYNGAWLDHANRKLYVGAQWKDSTSTDGNPELTYYGAIIAIDVNYNSPTLGNRQLFSGYTLDGSRGTGPTLRAVQAIEKGPDGKLYAVAYESGHPTQIWRFDMATGNRERIWIEQAIYHGQTMPASQCHNGSRVGFDATYNGQRWSLQYETTGTRLAMAPNGDFFLSAKQAGPANGPKGIVRISADGSRCEWVTRFGATHNNIYAEKPVAERGADYGLPNGTGPRGGGVNNYTFNPVNLFYMVMNGTPYVLARDGIGSGGIGTRHYRINVANGERETLFQDIAGDSHTFWDPHRELLWMTGVFGGTIIAPVDIMAHGGTVNVLGNIRCLSTNSTWYYCMRGPGDMGKQYRGGVVYDPYDHNLLMVHDQLGIVRVEVETGNTYTISR